MSRPSNILLPVINYDHTLVLSVELSNKSWVLAAQVPGLPRTKAQRTIEPNKNALLAAIDGYRARAAAVGYTVDRVITTYEAGWSGFWLARWLVAQGVEVHVVQPSSVPVDRRLRLADCRRIRGVVLLPTKCRASHKPEALCEPRGRAPSARAPNNAPTRWLQARQGTGPAKQKTPAACCA